MKQNNTLISQLMIHLDPQMTRIFKRAEERWAILFASCPSAQNITSSAVSHLIAGRRIIPREYITTYADISHPRSPILLSKDLASAIDSIWPTFSERATLFHSLVSFIRSNIDPIDQPELLPQDLHTIPNEATILLLFTTVMWYCLCRDYSRI